MTVTSKPNALWTNCLTTCRRGCCYGAAHLGTTDAPHGKGSRSGTHGTSAQATAHRTLPRPQCAQVGGGCCRQPVFERTKRKGAVNQYYGKFIHEGTKDPRTSRKGRLLIFENERGEKIFTRSVRGLRAVPFLEIAYTQESERTVALFGDALAAAVEKFVVRNFKAVSP